MTKSDYETLAAFRYELRKFLNFSERAAENHGLAAQQYLALLAIEGFPGRDYLTVGELAEKMQILANSAVGLVDRLQASGLVTRKSSKEDRRRVHVTLTSQGRIKLKELAVVHHTELQSVGPLLREILKRVEAFPSSSQK
jgi:DNA-binding MarR family transcriptional regulator